MGTLDVMLKKIEQAKALDFGNILSASIELFKKVWVNGLVVLLLQVALMIPLYLIVYLPFLAFGLFNTELFNGNQYFNNFEGLSFALILLMIVVYLFMITGVIFVQVGLKAAYYRIVNNKDLMLNQSDDYFFFFKRAYLKKTLVLVFAMIGIGLLALIFCVLPIFYAIIPMTYMTVIYAFNPDLSVSEIVKAGFELGNKKWLISFGLAFVAWFLSGVVGLLFCFVGVYVTQQFINLPFYGVYKRVVGFNETDAIDEIGTVIE